MENLRIPYGKKELKIKLNLTKEIKFDILKPEEKNGLTNILEKIKDALNTPINSPPLRKLALNKRNACIIIDDLTRPLPSNLLLPPVVNELEKGGIKKDKIKVIIALGLHRPLKKEEKKKLVGSIFEEIKVFNHNPYKNLMYLGKTSFGTEIYLNKNFLKADLKIIISDVEFHQLFGYGGGAKSLHPGIGDAESIKNIHSRLDLPGAEAGIFKGNPLREEIEEIGNMVNVDFSLNVVLNSNKKICGIFAGRLSSAFQKAIKLVDKMYKVKISCLYDLVIVSAGGYPRDINLYQAQKAIEAARKIVKKGGKIILFAECSEGWGSQLFKNWMKNAKGPENIKKKIKKDFFIGAHKAYLLAKELEWAKIYIYSDMKPEEVKKAFLIPVRLEEINDIVKDEKNIAFLPFGTITLPQIL